MKAYKFNYDVEKTPLILGMRAVLSFFMLGAIILSVFIVYSLKSWLSFGLCLVGLVALYIYLIYRSNAFVQYKNGDDAFPEEITCNP